MRTYELYVPEKPTVLVHQNMGYVEGKSTTGHDQG